MRIESYREDFQKTLQDFIRRIYPSDENIYLMQLAHFRKTCSYDPNLELLLLENDKAVGHLLLLPTLLIHETSGYPCLKIASLLGEKEENKHLLLSAGKERAKNTNVLAIFATGKQDFYTREGFFGLKELSLYSLDGIPEEYAYVFPLTKDLPSGGVLLQG